MLIKYATEADLPSSAQWEHIPKSVLLDKIRRGEVLAAFDGAELIGWLRFGLFWDSVPFMNLLIVTESRRNQGVGRELVLFWEARMRELGYSAVMTSSQQNEFAQHFYTKLGYKAVGGFTNTDDEYEIIFSKELGI